MPIQLEADMEVDEWTRRCAARLREDWPDTAEDELRDIAATLWGERKWNRLSPEVAAIAWLRLRPTSRGVTVSASRLGRRNAGGVDLA